MLVEPLGDWIYAVIRQLSRSQYKAQTRSMTLDVMVVERPKFYLLIVWIFNIREYLRAAYQSDEN
jgi:hypothetical protein